MDNEIEDSSNILDQCTVFQCRLCAFNGNSKDTFLAHYQSHLVKMKEKIMANVDDVMQSNPTQTNTESILPVIERFICSICYDIFEEKHLVREHMINDHNYVSKEQNIENSPSKAKEKAINVPSKSEDLTAIEDEWFKPMSLKVLRKKLRQNYSIRCTLKGCKFIFETVANREIHEKCHISLSVDQLKTFRCFECSWESKCWRNCSAHLWKEHQIDVDLMKCPFCSYKASLIVQIFRHLQIHGHPNEFACADCPKTFKQYSHLRVHTISHMDGAKKDGKIRWYSEKNCDICGHTFANSKILSKHIKVVHNKIRPFICSVCGHKSARKAGLLIHMRQHTGEKPLQCKECTFKAADPSVLKKHELRHNKATNAPYKCPDCNYKSVQSITLKIHLKKYHPNLYKTVVCDQCSFVSINPNILNRHKQDHQSGIIPNEDSNEVERNLNESSHSSRTITEKPNQNVEISSDCFLPLESTDSLAQDPPLDTGGVTIPAHSEETQFPCFMNP